MSDGYRHRLTDAQQKMPERDLVAGLPDGQGLSVYRQYSWDVLRRVGPDGNDEYIVVESSTSHPPLLVYGPTSRAAATAWVQTSAQVWHALKHQQPEWPWEG